jgi:multidrug/hemolysin transport system permease protein
MIGAFVLRNWKLYFRDRLAVFFSLLSVLIIMVMYVLFLGNSIAGAARDLPPTLTRAFLDSWIIAGVLAAATLTTSLAALGSMVDDKASGIWRDFFVSPAPRWRIVLGYLLSSVAIGVAMSAVLLFCALFYLALTSGMILPLPRILSVAVWMLVGVVQASALHFVVLCRMKSRSAFSALSTVVGSLLGFLMAIYIPLGYLPPAVQWLIKLFPPSHVAVMLRQEMIGAVIPLNQLDAGNRAYLGIEYQFGSTSLHGLDHLAIIIASTVLFFALALLLIRTKKR